MKVLKKSECRIIDGFIIKGDEVFAAPCMVAEQWNKLHDICKKFEANALKSEVEQQAADKIAELEEDEPPFVSVLEPDEELAKFMELQKKAVAFRKKQEATMAFNEWLNVNFDALLEFTSNDEFIAQPNGEQVKEFLIDDLGLLEICPENIVNMLYTSFIYNTCGFEFIERKHKEE